MNITSIILNPATPDEIARITLNQALHIIEQLEEEDPAAITGIATGVIGSYISLQSYQVRGELTEPGAHVLKAIGGLLNHLGLEIKVTAIKPESSPEQDHL